MKNDWSLAFYSDFRDALSADRLVRSKALSRLRQLAANPVELQKRVEHLPDQARAIILLRILLEELAPLIWKDGNIPPRVERILRDFGMRERPSFDLVCSMIAELHEGLADVEGDFPPPVLIVFVAISRAMPILAKGDGSENEAGVPRAFSIQGVAWLYVAIQRKDFQTLLSVGWEDKTYSTRLVARSFKLRKQLTEIADAANHLLFSELPRVRPCIKQIRLCDSQGLAVEMLPHLLSFFKAIELLPAELVVDDAGLKTLGIFDEFRRREEFGSE